MKARMMRIALAAGLLSALLCGCGSKEQTVSQAGSTQQAQAVQETTAPSVETKKMHIAVETVEISLSDLAAQDYTVPVHVYLEQNAGVTYSEWGLKMDERCTFAVQSPADEPLALTVYHAENAEQHFIWTAWASGTQIISSTGPILVVDVTLPKDAAAGDKYTVDYADWSLADKGHVWSNDADDWSEQDEVSWVDGGITITE